ncbi:MAG: hypothetical protein CMJ80_03365 [Planctomycetaceae bacterium]|jgi:hypothetical protein|nr:hypothetical protein [Planctomycetaceae bacterium]
MADKFDPYREALVIETETVWPEEFDDLTPVQRGEIEAQLHQDPENVASLEYVRVHSGFCRKIMVTADDVDRVRG